MFKTECCLNGPDPNWREREVEGGGKPASVDMLGDLGATPDMGNERGVIHCCVLIFMLSVENTVHLVPLDGEGTEHAILQPVGLWFAAHSLPIPMGGSSQLIISTDGLKTSENNTRKGIWRFVLFNCL